MATTALFGDTEPTNEGFESVLSRLTGQYSIRPLSEQSVTGTLYLRHDVSLSLADAVRMAKREAEHGIRGTYCIMLGSPLFNPLDETQQTRIREIESQGHEIGLLCNTHDHWEKQPETDELESLVSRQQSILDEIVEDSSEVVSFHRPPSWIQQRNFPEFQNALASAYTSEIAYIEDCPRTREGQELHNKGDPPESLQVVVHPALWMSSVTEYERKIEQSVIDSCRYVNRRARAEFVDPRRES